MLESCLVLFSFPYLFQSYEKINVSENERVVMVVGNSAVSEAEEFTHCHGNVHILATAY